MLHQAAESIAPCSDVGRLLVPVQNNEIAAIIAVTPEPCPRTLARLQKQGVIERKRRGKLLIHDKPVKHPYPFAKFFR